MKIIIAGSRSIQDYNKLLTVMNNLLWPVDEVVSGGANGVDKLGEKLAIDFVLDLKVFPADWDQYGKSAGFIRNQLMAEYADALVCIWDGRSKGTKHMIDTMFKLKKPVHIEFV